jgi:hypothetical protein
LQRGFKAKELAKLGEYIVEGFESGLKDVKKIPDIKLKKSDDEHRQNLKREE